MSYIQIQSLEKRFGSVPAVQHFNLEVEQGEMVAFLGPSGCGKSTTLRMIAGLERPDRGYIRLAGQEVTTAPPHKRHVGMVFQEYALFPNMTVAQNIAFGPMIARVSASDRQERVRELSGLMGLQDLVGRYPHQLSGGQKQRVALARALATRPKVLLLDEPLSALDAPIRRSLGAEIRRVQQEVGISAIYVTHDQEEALALADRVAVMNRGMLCEVGTPQQIHRRPRSSFTAEFVGNNNVFKAIVLSKDPPTIDCGGVPLRCSAVGATQVGDKLTVVIPAEELRLLAASRHENRFTGAIRLKTFHGPLSRIELEVEGQRWLGVLPSSQVDAYGTGDDLQVFVAPESCHVLNEV